LGYALEAQQKFPEALGEFRKATEKNPDDFQAHFALGRILVNQESYQDGIQHLLKCLDSHDEGNKPAYLYALGAAYARSGNLKNGVRYLRQAREAAEARNQPRMVESIDADLKELERKPPPQ
jgi:tetratricopeptide (TPR) repeat protein